LIVFLCFSLSLNADEIAQQEDNLKILKQKIALLQSHLNQDQMEKNGLIHLLRESEIEISQVSQKIYQLNIQITQKKQQLIPLKQQQQRQQQEINKQQTLLAKQVKAHYIMGQKAQIKMMLNQQQAEPMARMMAYYRYLNHARIQQLTQLQRKIFDLMQFEQQLFEQTHFLENLKFEFEQKKVIQQQAMHKRQQVLSQLENEINEKYQKLDQLHNNEKDLLKLLTTIRQSLIELPNNQILKQKFSQQKGKIRWPLTGLITQNYGSRRADNLRWDGILIKTTEGQDIHAIYHGRIAYADWLRGFGLLIIMDHGDGYMSLYGHNQSIFKEIGEWVNTGDVIGLAGKSGGRTEAGIYFGIRLDGKAINPKKWCKRIKGRKIN